MEPSARRTRCLQGALASATCSNAPSVQAVPASRRPWSAPPSITETPNFEGAVPAGGSHQPLVLVVDAHGIIATSLTTALRHAGFQRVATVDPDVLQLDGQNTAVEVVAGDIVLIGLLFGDGRTTLPLIRPLAVRGCRVLVWTSDQGLTLTGECLDRGAEAVLDKGMSFERLVAALRRLISGGCAMTDEERNALLESVERHEVAERILHKPFTALTQREAEGARRARRGDDPQADRPRQGDRDLHRSWPHPASALQAGRQQPARGPVHGSPRRLALGTPPPGRPVHRGGGARVYFAAGATFGSARPWSGCQPQGAGEGGPCRASSGGHERGERPSPTLELLGGAHELVPRNSSRTRHHRRRRPLGRVSIIRGHDARGAEDPARSRVPVPEPAT